MADKDQKESGIKSVSVGLGSGPRQRPDEVPPVPFYRVLLAGDFGINDDGICHELAGRDLADLLSDLCPEFTIEVENLLGSHPSRLSETISLEKPRHLRPENLLPRMTSQTDAREAVDRNDPAFLERFGQRYNSLLQLLAHPSAGSVSADETRAGTPSGEGDPSEPSDDIDRLLSMVAIPAGKAIATPAKSVLESFIENNVVRRSEAGKSTDRSSAELAGELLLHQAGEFFSEPRCRQVLENWLGLRLLLGNTRGEGAPTFSLLQIDLDADADTISQKLAGREGALPLELYDLIIFANRCALKNEGISKLKALASAAHEFDTLALATLTPDFSDIPAEQLAAMDAPHQCVDRIGFEAFQSLRNQEAAHHLGLLWNDGLIRAVSTESPEYFVPAGWIAVTMISQHLIKTGWPALPPNMRIDLDALEVHSKKIGGRELADAVRATLASESAASLASIGISALAGQENRANVYFPFATLNAGGTGDESRPITDGMVLARINCLLQSVLMESLDANQPLTSIVQALDKGLSEVTAAYSDRVQFDVSSGTADDGGPVIEISAHVARDIAAQQIFEFKVHV